MQPKVWVAGLIFLASYLPLAMILALQDLSPEILERPLCENWPQLLTSCSLPLKHPAMAAVPILVCCLCLGVAIFALASARPSTPIVVKSAKHVPADLMNYTLPYIVTFMSLDYSDPAKLAGFAAFIAWIFLITFRSGQLLMNPVLTVFGWQLYDIQFTYEGGSDTQYEAVALVKGGLTPDTTVLHQPIQNMFVIKEGS